MDYQWKDENEYKKYSKPFSQFLLSYENYWKFALLYLIMKHCQRAKYGAPTIRLVKHSERGNFPMIWYRIARRGQGKDLVKPTPLHMGQERETHWWVGFTQVVCGAYFNIQGVSSTWEESTKLDYIGSGYSLPPPTAPNPHPTIRNPVFRICEETIALIMFGDIFDFDIDRKFIFNH